MATQRKENPRRSRLTPIEIAMIRKLREEGYTTQQIVEKTGRSEQAILIYSPQRMATKAKIPQKTISRIRRMRREGKTVQEITDKLGVGRATVLRYAGRTPSHDIPTALAKVRSLDAAGIRNRKEQARIIGVHYNTLYQWLRDYGQSERWNPTVKELRAIRQGYFEADGKTVYMRAVAQRYGISYGTVQNIVYRKGRYEFL
jgi:transposase